MASTKAERVLDLELPDSHGKVMRIKESMGEKGLLLVFYRGSFCPYCAGQLASINEYTKRLSGTGVNVVAISVDSVAESRAFSKQLGLTFPVLSDEKKFSIKLFGVLETKKGPSYPPGISKPAVFLIDKKGKVHYSYVSRDQIDRPSTEEIVSAAKRLQ